MRKPHRLFDLASRLAPALGAWAALGVLGRFSRVPDAEAIYLALPVLGVLAAAGCLSPRRRGEAPLGALGTVLATWVLPTGPVRGATVLALLAVTLAMAVTRRETGPARWTPGAWLALTFGLQFLLRSPRLFEPDWGLRLAGTFAVLPVAAAAALVLLARRFGSRTALAVGLLAVLPDAGLSVYSTLTLVLLAGLSWITRPGTVRVPGPALALIGGLAFAVSLAGTYPWMRAEPLSTVVTGGLDLLQSPAGPVAADSGVPVALSRSTPSYVLDGFEDRISHVVLDTHLINSAALPPGTPVATVRLKTRGGRSQGTWTLTSGTDTGEWAASRPDVAATAGFQAPAPWVSWIPAGGGFFAHRYRSRFELDEPVEAAALSIVRRSDLPEDVGLVVMSAEVR